VLASDAGVPPRSTRVGVRISVTDVDDSSARFQRSNYVFSVRENQPRDTAVGRVRAADADQVPFSDVVYALDRITGYDANGSVVAVSETAFSVDSSSGSIVTSYPLDRETVSGYRIDVTATSTIAGSISTATATVVVNVVDLNDNAPVFLFPTETETADGGVEDNPVIVSLSADIGDVVATILATDSDASANGQLVYSITGTTPNSARSLFTLDRVSGKLVVARKLPGVGVVRMQLAATDGGEVLSEVDRLTSSSTLVVNVVGGRDRPLRRVENDSLMSALASQHLAVVLTATLHARPALPRHTGDPPAVRRGGRQRPGGPEVLTATLALILLTISAIIALLCLLRLRRLHRRRRHDDVKYVDGYGCSRDLSCFRFHDGDAGGRMASCRDATELKKLPVNVDGDVACKEYQVRLILQ